MTIILLDTIVKAGARPDSCELNQVSDPGVKAGARPDELIIRQTECPEISS